jgi:hypothetical protein
MIIESISLKTEIGVGKKIEIFLENWSGVLEDEVPLQEYTPSLWRMGQTRHCAEKMMRVNTLNNNFCMAGRNNPHGLIDSFTPDALSSLT